MMKGHKWECFVFEMSFFPWLLLGGATFGISEILYSNPYRAAFFSEYYADMRAEAKKAHLKGQKVTKYKYIGLWLFVALPLPGTGAWTGALIAALLDMPLRKSIPSIFLGVVTAGLIMTFVTGGVVAIFAS